MFGPTVQINAFIPAFWNILQRVVFNFSHGQNEIVSAVIICSLEQEDECNAHLDRGMSSL